MSKGSAVAYLNEPPSNESTIIVLGFGRGGTSAIAGALRELGVHMPDPHPLKHESSPIKYKPDGNIDLEVSIKQIEALNKLYSKWGWKSPQDLFALDRFQAHVRKPVLVIIYRNFLTTCLSAGKYEEVPWQLTASAYARVNTELARVLTYSPLPIAALAFEELKKYPRKVMLGLNDWLHLGASSQQINAASTFAKATSYRATSAENHDGVFSEAELATDRKNAQGTIYGDSIARIEGATKALRVDLQAAEEAIAHLQRELKIADVEPTLLLAHILDKAKTERAAPPVASADTSTGGMPQLTRYVEVRRDYNEVVRLRIQAQTILDRLAILTSD